MSADEAGRLRAALHSKNRHERAEAAIALGHAGDRQALATIEAMAQEADDLVAIAALHAASRLTGEPRGIARIAGCLASGDEETMQLAVHALCDLGDSAVPDLERALTQDSPVKQEIVRVLADLGGHEAKAALERAARSTDAAIASTARAALERRRPRTG